MTLPRTLEDIATEFVKLKFADTDTHRWNVDVTNKGIVYCDDSHEKGEACHEELIRLIRAAGVMYRHKKRGTMYHPLFSIRLQIEPDVALKDGDTIMVYVGEDLNFKTNAWGRLPEEFFDGRFDAVPNSAKVNPKDLAIQPDPIFAKMCSQIDYVLNHYDDPDSDRETLIENAVVCILMMAGKGEEINPAGTTAAQSGVTQGGVIYSTNTPYYNGPDDAPMIAMSTCDQCQARYPTAPDGAVHKCGSCSGGRMVPDRPPTIPVIAPVVDFEKGQVSNITVTWDGSRKHPSHKTQFSFDSSSYDEKCENCHHTDATPGGWGELAKPCPNSPETKEEVTTRSGSLSADLIDRARSIMEKLTPEQKQDMRNQQIQSMIRSGPFGPTDGMGTQVVLEPPHVKVDLDERPSFSERISEIAQLIYPDAFLPETPHGDTVYRNMSLSEARHDANKIAKQIYIRILQRPSVDLSELASFEEVLEAEFGKLTREQGDIGRMGGSYASQVICREKIDLIGRLKTAFDKIQKTP